MNGRWNEGGLMIELFKTTRASMKFDRMIPSGSSWLMGIKTQRLVGQAHAVIEPGKSIPIWKFHQMTGHTGEHLLRTTAENMGIKLTGKNEPCEICAQAKIRQANIPKKKEKQVPSRPGYRLFIDISSFKHDSMGGKRHWLIAVDKFSDCSHSFFLKRKSDQIIIIPTWIKGLKAKYGIDVKYIWLDNRGENRSLQKECEKQNLGIIFEFTAPGTPQQNSVVERKIPTLMGRSRAMMIEAGFSQQDKRKFWCEVISTATKLDNIIVRKERTKPPYTLFYNDEPKYKKYLRSFGEMAVIAISDEKKTYGARLVALGYSQIPGVDYTDNFAPVAHDVSFRIALARMMVEKLDSLVMDVETAFLYGDIEEAIFMKSPVGMEEIDPGSSPEDSYQLKKGIYGLCQAARQFWRKFVDTIKKEPFGFSQLAQQIHACCSKRITLEYA